MMVTKLIEKRMMIVILRNVIKLIIKIILNNNNNGYYKSKKQYKNATSYSGKILAFKNIANRKQESSVLYKLITSSIDYFCIYLCILV